MQGHKKQSGRSGLGLSNFIHTKPVHEHFDLIIHVDVKTSENENFSIIRHKTIYCLDQLGIHALSEFIINAVNVTN